MFGNKNRPESGITLIATNCEINGDVLFSDQLQVNGTVNGNILAQDGSGASVTISEKGRVVGEVRVPNVIVNGKVEGDIYADKHIELAANAEITGNVYYNLIEMVKGSCVEGKLVHCEPGDKSSAPAKTPEPTTRDDESPVAASTQFTAIQGRSNQVS